MKTRMQPIGNVWNKFPRVVRDLALEPAASRSASRWRARRPSSTRRIIEAIKDPLTHIVRNSVDHGIETPDGRVRSAASRPRAGSLLRAFHEGGQVNIEITDDGGGHRRRAR